MLPKQIVNPAGPGANPAGPGASPVVPGANGIAAVWTIALPMIISSASTTVIIFCDRLFLSYLSTEALAASMPGGLTSFMFSSFFFGTIGYVNALAAQYYGAGEKGKSSRAAWQGIYVALIASCIIYACIPLGRFFFTWFSDDPSLLDLENRFFTILTCGAVFSLSNAALSGFFSGISKTGIVMRGNLLAMLLNVPLNGLLIFGLPDNPVFAFAGFGVSGAAFASVIAMAAASVYFFSVFCSRPYRAEYGTVAHWHFNRDIFSRLLRFGLPAGVEFFLNLSAFNLFVLLAGSVGTNEQAAINITFSWNLIAFLPLLGIGIATTTLTGQNIGGGNYTGAIQATYSALKIAYLYIVVVAGLYLFLPGYLVGVFGGRSGAEEFKPVLVLAKQMLMLASLYTLADAATMVFEGTLRGGGDTRFIMIASSLLHWFCLVMPTVILVYVLKARLIWLWLWFIGFALVHSAVMCRRFFTGAWKTIRVIEPSVNLSAELTSIALRQQGE